MVFGWPCDSYIGEDVSLWILVVPEHLYTEKDTLIINHFYFSFIENTHTYVIMMCIDVINKFHFRILKCYKFF